MGASVEYLRYTLKALLPCRVPNLELEYLLLQLHKECSEFDADRDLMIRHELIVC